MKLPGQWKPVECLSTQFTVLLLCKEPISFHLISIGTSVDKRAARCAIQLANIGVQSIQLYTKTKWMIDSEKMHFHGEMLFAACKDGRVR